MAALALVNSRLQLPMVVIIKGVKGNAKKVAVDLQKLLSRLCTGCRYVNGETTWSTVQGLVEDRFKTGKCVLVMSARATNLANLNALLARLRIAGNSLLAS